MTTLCIFCDEDITRPGEDKYSVVRLFPHDNRRRKLFPCARHKVQAFLQAIVSQPDYTSFEHVLKTDDDSFVSFIKLARAIERHHEDKYWGKLVHNSRVIRVKSHPLYVAPEAIPLPVAKTKPDVYPDYCSGQGYVLEHSLVKCMAERAKKQPFLPAEDTYTGVLGKRITVSFGNFFTRAILM